METRRQLWNTLLVTIDRQDRNRLLWVFVIALLVRGAVVVLSPQTFVGDPDAYRIIAETLANDGVYGVSIGDLPPQPTAFRPPLYPYLLSWLTPSESGELLLWAVGVLHVICGALTVVLTVWVASRLLAEPLVADRLVDGQPTNDGRIGAASLLAGLLTLIDPILVQQSTQIMTETLAGLLSMAVIAWWVGQVAVEARSPNVLGSVALRFLGLSVLLALAYLCRPTFLVWAALLVVGAVFARRQSDWRSRVMQGGLVASLVLVALAGWTWRNATSVGHPIWATSHGGYTLLLANNESFYDYLRNGTWGEAWGAEPFLEAYDHRYDGDPNEAEFWQRDWSAFTPTSVATAQPATQVDFSTLTEHEDDQRCYQAARATIDRQPAMFLWSCVVRVGRLWSPVPHHVSGRGWLKVIAVGAYYFVMYLAIAVMVWRFRWQLFRRRWWAILTLAVTLSGVHLIYWTNIRMRAPIIPALAVMAAGAIVNPRTADSDSKLTKEHGGVAND